MKEIVLPVSGDFATMRMPKFTELMQIGGSAQFGVDLIAMCVSIDGRQVDIDRLDSLDLRDAMAIHRMITDALKGIDVARGVA